MDILDRFFQKICIPGSKKVDEKACQVNYATLRANRDSWLTPVFVRGLSRSGGTLLVSILDAHPDIAMSYELYPNLIGDQSSTAAEAELDEELGCVANLDVFIEVCDALRRTPQRLTSSKLKNMGLANWSTFIARCKRGGISKEDVTVLLSALLADPHDFRFGVTGDHSLNLIGAIGASKALKFGATRFGMKCTNQYGRYLAHWPKAKFINIVRDGRDVYASQLLNGNFRPVAGQLASAWVRSVELFRHHAKAHTDNFFEIRYEDLVSDLENGARRICAFIEADFAPQMLSHHNSELTLLRDPAGHLSADRIAQPVDSKRIGRWQSVLTSKQAADFNKIAGPTLRDLGYMNSIGSI